MTALDYLSVLDPAADWFTFQLFHPTDKRKARIYHGSLSKLRPTLKKANDAKLGVYVCMNETDFTGRSKENIVRVRAVWIDDDSELSDQPRTDFDKQPHACVQTSPKKFQYFWLIRDCSLDQCEKINRALANKHNTDLAVVEYSRVLRLPDFVNTKNNFQVKLIYTHPDLPPYKVSDFPVGNGKDQKYKHIEGTPVPRGGGMVNGVYCPGYDAALTSWCGTLVSRGLEGAELEAALFKEADEVCPGYTRKDVERILKNSNKWEPGVNFDKLMEQVKTGDLEKILIDAVKLSPLEQGQLLQAIKKHHSIPLGDLRKQLEQNEKAQEEEAARRMIEQIKQEQFSKGLIRERDQQFWSYTGKFWEPLTDEYVEQQVMRTVEDSDKDYKMGHCYFFTKLLATDVVDYGRLVNAEIMPVVNCRNYEVWILEDGTVEHRPHSADSNLTHCLPIDYSPGAKAPLWDQTILEIFALCEDAEGMKRHLEEVLGWILGPFRYLAYWFLLEGPGSDGKSSIGDLIQWLLGPSATCNERINAIAEDKFLAANLVGRKLVIDDDLESGSLLPDGFLKKISERKHMTGQHKHKAPFDFVAQVVPLLLCNNTPSCSDLSWGLRRRAMIIPMHRRFYSSEARLKKDPDGGLADPKRFERIKNDEGAGVLNQLLAGLKRVVDRGDFDEPIDSLLARRSWFKQANNVAQFTQEDCYIDPGYKCKIKDLYKAYQDWTKEAGVSKFAVSRNRFTRDLKNLDYIVNDVMGYSWVHNLRHEKDQGDF